jgi:hypothetical protein
VRTEQREKEGSWANHGDVNESVQAGGSPLVGDPSVKRDNAQKHGDPMVVHMAAGKEKKNKKKTTNE